MLGELTVSMLKGERGFQKKEIEKMLDWLKTEAAPDVVSIPYTLLISLAEPIKRALGRPVCCTLQGEDLFLEGLREPYRSDALELIRNNIKHVDAFFAVSEYYADFMAGYLGIPAEKIHVIPLGINLDGYGKRQTQSSESFTVGYFARIGPEKGLHILVEAYKKMRKEVPAARLEVAGYMAPEHHKYLRDCEQKLAAAGLGDEFNYRGVLDRAGKIQFLQTLDVLSVPATYAEPKGIFLLEAMACGVPVVQPEHGAFPEIISKTGGGILVEPDNSESVARGLLHLYHDPSLRAKLGDSGFDGVREHYSAARMADRAEEVYEQLASHGAAEHALVQRVV